MKIICGVCSPSHCSHLVVRARDSICVSRLCRKCFFLLFLMNNNETQILNYSTFFVVALTARKVLNLGNGSRDLPRISLSSSHRAKTSKSEHASKCKVGDQSVVLLIPLGAVHSVIPKYNYSPRFVLHNIFQLMFANQKDVTRSRRLPGVGHVLQKINMAYYSIIVDFKTNKPQYISLTAPM